MMPTPMSNPMRPLATVQDRPKGVVAPAAARKMFRMERYLPTAGLAAFLDHFWIVEWDLGGQPPYVQRTLPYPCVHLVFRPLDRDRRMPLMLGFVLTGFFIWMAENIGTYWGVWRYPNQLGAWSAVHISKWSSWRASST
jgi:uncharacterized membrane protein YoaT (DUF817 family)